MKTTKQLFFYAFVFCAILTSFNFSCDKVKDAVKVDVPMQTAELEFKIEKIAQADVTVTSQVITTNINLDSLIKDKNASLGIKNIKSVKVKSCVITLGNSTDLDNFGALKSCKAELSSNGGDWITFAEIANNPDAVSNTLTLPINSNVELKSYFTQNSFSYRISASSRRATSTVLNATAKIKFNLEVGL